MTGWARRLEARLGALDGLRARQWLQGTKALRALRRSEPGPGRGAVVAVESHVDVVRVLGWVNRGRLPVAVVVVVVTANGTPFGVAAPDEHLVSPALIPHLGEAPDRAGWAVVVERRYLTPGLTEFGAMVIVDGRPPEPLDPLRVNVSERFAGALDVPAAGAVVHPPTLMLQGWALSSQGLDRVEVSVGGGPRQRARPLAEPRDDVRAISEDPLAPMAGWQLIVDIPDAPLGERLEITAVAVDGKGEFELGRSEVMVGDSSFSEPRDPAWVASLGARVPCRRAQPQTPRAGLRCLTFTHDLGLGGGQLYLSDLLNTVLRQPDVVCTILAPRDGPLRSDLEALGATVHLTGTTLPTTAPEYESRMSELAHLAAAHDANVVLANTAGCFMGIDLAGRCGLPSIWSIHESYTPDQFLTAAFGPGGIDAHIRRRFMATFSSATAVVFEADATLRQFVHLGDPSRFIRVDYGIPLTEIDSYRSGFDRASHRSAHGFRQADDIIVCLGTFEPRKGHAALLAAFHRIASEFPDARLVLVGDTGSLYAQGLRTMLERLQLAGRVRLEPVTPRVYSWYGMMDLFVTASDIESLPRSVLEAMAFGVPVLATDVYGLPELIEDGVNGLLCAPLDVAALADGLARLLSLSSEERLAMSGKAEMQVRTARDASDFGHVYHRLLKGLAQDPGVHPRKLVPEH